MTDEYGELYNGFRFTSYDHGLGHSAVLSGDDEMDIPDDYKNPDKLVIWCHNCCCYMVFCESDERLEGYWRCPECGKTIKEMTAYRRISQDDRLDEKREQQKQQQWDSENDNDWD